MVSPEELAARLADPAHQRQIAAEQLGVRLGYELRHVRLARGITAAELAEMADSTEETISKLERGDYLDAGLRLIARVAFQLEIDLTMRLRDLSASLTKAPSDD